MDKQPHALVVSGPGLGHVNGCMALAKSLVSVGFSVTLACFARSYHTHSKRNRLQPAHPSIRLEVVPDGLSPDAQNYQDLFVTTDTMQDSLHQLIQRLKDEQNPVTCLVSDSLVAWTQDVAVKFGLPRIDYWTATATSYLFVLAVPELISKGYICQKGEAPASQWKSESPVFIDCMPGLPDFRLDELPMDFRFADLESDPIMQRLVMAANRASEAERVLIHSVYYLEASAFKALKELGIKAYAIGPLPFDDLPSQQQDCLTWLDGQTNSSVIYVSFGSNATLSYEEILELAHGLEASGQPFLWVVRSDATAEGGQLYDILPAGFQIRTQNRALIVPWAPQPAVLAHLAVGGFLTHCGWNSTLETLWMGVPILACPRGAEQRTNARLIAQEWGVGIELERTDTGGFQRSEVEKSVKALMIGEEGLHARSKAREMKEVVKKSASKGGLSHSNLLKLAGDMRAFQCGPVSNVAQS